MRKFVLATSLLLTGFSVAGCSMAPTYERPAIPVTDHWGQDINSVGITGRVLNWQTFIVDPQLRRLVEVALNNNRSLRQSLLDIEQARAQYRVQRADRLPNLDANATGGRQRVPTSVAISGAPNVTNTFQVGLSLPEYELDLFGRIKSLTDAALEQYLATEAAARAAQISLVAEISQAYVTYAGAQRRLELTQRTLASREDSLQLTSQRRTTGTATDLDYQEALGLAQQSRAELEVTIRERKQSVNASVLLLGTPHAESIIPRVPGNELRFVQDIVPGAPSELLEQRPDIIAAEHRLKARNADTGAARAAFFPRISLTGSYGNSSSQMASLFDGASRSWSFMPALSLPIFEAGRNTAALDLAMVRRDSAVAEYEGSIQTAFREVADALVATDTLTREEDARRALAETSNEALRLSRARYEGGLDDHLRYLDAQRNSFINQLALIETATQRQIALVSLFRSVGGGWTESAEALY